MCALSNHQMLAWSYIIDMIWLKFHPFEIHAGQAQLILPYLLPDVRLPRAPCFMPRSVPWIPIFADWVHYNLTGIMVNHPEDPWPYFRWKIVIHPDKVYHPVMKHDNWQSENYPWRFQWGNHRTKCGIVHCHVGESFEFQSLMQESKKLKQLFGRGIGLRIYYIYDI